MPKIVAIANDMDQLLARGLEALGDLHLVHGRGFAQCHEDLRNERDADLLITNLPPGRTSFEGYGPSIHVVHETIMDLRIPAIVHTGMSARHLWQLGSLPAFVHPKEFGDSDARVLATAMAIAKIWFPMAPRERIEFMDETLRLHQEEASRPDTIFTDADCILLERFQVASAEEIGQMREMNAQAREMMSPEPCGGDSRRTISSP